MDDSAKHTNRFFVSALLVISTHSAYACGPRPELVCGVYGCRGLRERMEDVYTTVTPLPNNRRVNLFGVFDGHGCEGGHEAATTASQLLPTTIDDMLRLYGPGRMRRAVIEAFHHTDRELRDRVPRGGGTTATAALIERDDAGDMRISLAHAGDSRAIVCDRFGEILLATRDHRPDDPGECSRIREAGAHVAWGNPAIGTPSRVGGLAVSRTLGDWDIRERLPAGSIIAEPGFSGSIPFEPGSFCVIASDGLWDRMASTEAAHITALCLTATERPATLAATVLDAQRPSEWTDENLPAGMAEEARGLREDAARDGLALAEAIADLPDWGRVGQNRCTLAAELLARIALDRASADNTMVMVITRQARQEHPEMGDA